MADNIIHLVLARLPDAPPGTRGISLFLVPKFLVNDDGSLGARNDVALRRASSTSSASTARPTCVMIYGEKGGATGYLVGEENRGLAAMFVMMNARGSASALQGVAIAERAYQQALAYARERRQGRAPTRRRRGMSADHRAPRRAAHAADDEGLSAGRARDLPPDGGLASTSRATAARRRRAPDGRASAPRC